MDYTTMWQQASESFDEWVSKSGMPFTEEDRMLFVAGWVNSYLNLTKKEAV